MIPADTAGLILMWLYVIAAMAMIAAVVHLVRNYVRRKGK